MKTNKLKSAIAVVVLLALVVGAVCYVSGRRGGTVAKIEAQLDSLGVDTIEVRLFQAGSAIVERVDTVAAPGGRLKYEVAINESRYCSIQTLDGRTRGLVYLFPGVTLRLEGRLGQAPMTGHPVYDEIRNIELLTKEENERKNELYVKAITLHEEGRDEEVDATIVPLFNALDSIRLAKIKAYIEQHPATDGAVFLLSNEIGYEDFMAYDSIITPEAKAGLMAGFYNAARQRWESENLRHEYLKKLAPGMPAPDFTLPSLDGTALSLSDLRGKYVVIDFWGSWCGWCIKGIPDMKDYYRRYGDRLEILGVDCRDSEDAWRAAVEQHEMPWRHVRNSGDDVATDVSTLYAVEGYPTKAIIDPEGKIVKIIVGETHEFYTLLDELLAGSGK